MPVETKVVAAFIASVPPELIVPVRLMVAAPVVVSCACANVPLKAIPPVVVIVPVLAVS